MIDVVVTSAEGDSAIIVSCKYREAPCKYREAPSVENSFLLCYS